MLLVIFLCNIWRTDGPFLTVVDDVFPLDSSFPDVHNLALISTHSSSGEDEFTCNKFGCIYPMIKSLSFV